MSRITADDVRKVAKLARLDLPEEKITTYTGQLEKQIEGRRYIELSDPDKPGEGGWRLTGELHLGKDQRYQLSAH